MTELEPCPWCNGHSRLAANHAMPGNVVVIHEGEPHCPVRSGYFAVDQWNSRPSSDARKALTLAANRLDIHAVNAIANGDKRALEYAEWVDEARAAIRALGEDHG